MYRNARTWFETRTQRPIAFDTFEINDLVSCQSRNVGGLARLVYNLSQYCLPLGLSRSIHQRPDCHSRQSMPRYEAPAIWLTLNKTDFFEQK